MSDRVATAIATPEDVGQRADVVLGRRVRGLSRRVARRLALSGRLCIDGKRAKPSDRVALGQRLTLDLPAAESGPTAVRVLAVTDRFVYVDKPAGTHTVALTPEDPACLSVRVARVHPECAAASPDPREGGAVHRLDRDTSGVLAFARDRDSWEQARRAFERGEVRKRYVATCAPAAEPGWPPQPPPDALPGWLDAAEDLTDPVDLPPLSPIEDATYRIRAPLGRGLDRGRVAVRLDGQRATTLARGRGRAPAGLVCELELHTGRRHQARVHLAWIGLPIVGDVTYGEPGERLLLHAVRLDLSVSFPGERAVMAACPAALVGA